VISRSQKQKSLSRDGDKTPSAISNNYRVTENFWHLMAVFDSELCTAARAALILLQSLVVFSLNVTSAEKNPIKMLQFIRPTRGNIAFFWSPLVSFSWFKLFRVSVFVNGYATALTSSQESGK